MRHCNVTTSLEARGQEGRQHGEFPGMENAKLWRFYQMCGTFCIPVTMRMMYRYVSASVGRVLGDL